MVIRQHFLILLQNNEAQIESLHLQSVNATQKMLKVVLVSIWTAAIV